MNYEDVRMRNIENIYTDYNGLVDEITEEAIKNRIKQFQAEMQAFIDSNKLQDKVFIHQMALNHAVMDYYSDIQRLKSYQEMKRRPLQLKAQLEDDKWLYINEKFLLARIASFILRDNINIPLTKEKKEAFTNFLDTLYYYLKFRKTDAQAIELMLLGFDAGRIIAGK